MSNQLYLYTYNSCRQWQHRFIFSSIQISSRLVGTCFFFFRTQEFLCIMYIRGVQYDIKKKTSGDWVVCWKCKRISRQWTITCLSIWLWYIYNIYFRYICIFLNNSKEVPLWRILNSTEKFAKLLSQKWILIDFIKLWRSDTQVFLLST